MENKKILNDDQLSEISGGTSSRSPKIVEFEIEYTMRDSRYDIRDMIRQKLAQEGVPQEVISRVPIMGPEKSYMSYGSGGMRVTWQEGWIEPRYAKTHD